MQVSEAKSAESFGIGRVRRIFGRFETKRCGFHEPGQRWRPLGWERRSRLFVAKSSSLRAWITRRYTFGRTLGTWKRQSSKKQFILNRAKLVNGKKPFVLEEFGIIVGKSPEERKRDMKKRDLYFKNAYETTEKLAKEKKISGSMFWHFYDEGVGPGRFGVRTSDVSTWKLIENHAKFMAALSGLQTSCPSSTANSESSPSSIII